MITYYNI